VRNACLDGVFTFSQNDLQNADQSEIKVQVCVFLFDLLYLNGESLVTETFRKRRQLLRENFVEVEGSFFFAKDLLSDDTDEIALFLEEAVRGERKGRRVASECVT
jgi:DNA ligase-1